MSRVLNHKVFGQGQPLIILHGLFGSLDNWITLGKRFAENFKVVLVDQRNHGKSFHDDVFNYSEMADDLQHLIETLELKHPIVLGHSMGGKTVMQYAAFHPEVIDKLVVADIGPKSYPVHHQTIIEGLKSIDFSSAGNRQQVGLELEKYIPDFGTRSFLLKNVQRSSDGFSWKMNLDAISENIEEVGQPLSYYLPLEIPAFFIRGGASTYVLDEDFDDIKEIFPKAEFATIDGSGHWLHADNPQKFYEMVMNFILP